MAASYPGAVKNFSAVVNGVTKLVAALFNSPNDEITAIETELGTDVAGSLSDLKTRLAVSMNDDGTLNPQLGAWVDKSGGYGAQQAATDGFIVATVRYDNPSQNPGGAMIGYSDANADPTTERARHTLGYMYAGVPEAGSIMFPVKKGDYWKITVGNYYSAIAVYWIPIFST